MYDIALYLLDENYRQEIMETFRSPRYQLHVAEIWKDIISICQTDLIDLVMVWPANYSTVDDLQKSLKKSHLDHIPIMAVVRHPADFHALSSLKLAGIIQIPMPKREFVILLHQVLDSLRKGLFSTQPPSKIDDSEQITLLPTLRKLEEAGRDALLTLNDRGHIGRIYLKGGQIIRASFRALEGMDALKKLSGLFQAEIVTHYTVVEETKNIESAQSEILSELEQCLQEQKQQIAMIMAYGETLYPASAFPSEETNQNELRYQILELCRPGGKVYDLLLILNQNNLEILSEVKSLLQQNLLATGPELVMPAGDEKTKKTGSGRLSRFFSRFRREKKIKPVIERQIEEEIEPLTAGKSAVKPASLITPRSRIDLDEETTVKIQQYFTESI